MQKSMASLIRLSLLIVSFSLLFTSCEHELVKKPFQLREKTFYRISPKIPEPIVINGVTYTGTAFFPGGGTGTATHMGNIKTYFNQQVYSAAAEQPPLGSIAAPVKDVPGYMVLGGPLPLIQKGEFAELAALNTILQIPASVQGKIINQVTYNTKGDAVFTSAITGSGATFPLSETRVGFNGKAVIVGGRGKFANAVGEIDYNGSFSLVNPNDAEYNADGWISY
ncbi:MAG TPA: hypothetical protein VM935_11235 [Chitinophagaceae bacterium]|jgi:hypothetical protein|nr:hypothetical protein [Chitinophagaceae bacterium]